MPRQSAFALARKHRPAALAAQKIFVFLSAARLLHGQPHRLVSGCGSNFISVPPVHRVRVCFPFLSMILTAAAAMQNLMCQNFFDLFFFTNKHLLRKLDFVLLTGKRFLRPAAAESFFALLLIRTSGLMLPRGIRSASASAITSRKYLFTSSCPAISLSPKESAPVRG